MNKKGRISHNELLDENELQVMVTHYQLHSELTNSYYGALLLSGRLQLQLLLTDFWTLTDG